ncbi:uncharacterized protein LOC110027931, partial [Phalaenopsis equestris]|uniref:uncharacterized protein LOC110027931 n=1 Tax=Phalaenopsis equestris TaxID=78828 RepID=UPI0009E5E138
MSSEFCNVCGGPVWCRRHQTDLNRSVPMFLESNHEQADFHEFQFFGHDDSVAAWLFGEPKPDEPRDEQPPLSTFEYSVDDDLRGGSRPTFDVSRRSGGVEQKQLQPPPPPIMTSSAGGGGAPPPGFFSLHIFFRVFFL